MIVNIKAEAFGLPLLGTVMELRMQLVTPQEGIRSRRLDVHKNPVASSELIMISGGI